MLNSILHFFILAEAEALDPFTFVDPSEPLDYWSEFFKMFTGLGIILGIVLVGAYLLRRFLNKRMEATNWQHEIKILERRPLSQKSTLYLIESRGKVFLISDSTAGVHFLIECNATAEENNGTKASLQESFERIIEKKLNEISS